MNGLSIIIPVKPPEPYLEILTSKIHGWLYTLPHEILIQTEPGITNAVIKGVEKSRFDTIAVMDADGSHDPGDLHRMYNLIEEYELVVGSKSTGDTEDPLGRRFISRVYRRLAKTLLKLNVEDPMSGFVMGRKYIFLTLKPSTDYKFLLQLLTTNRSISVTEIPISFRKRQSGKSKTTVRTGLKTFSTIIKLWWKTKMRKRIFVAYLLTTIMMAFMAIIGTVNTYQLYLEHGWTYNMTMIIKNVETVTIINLANNIVAVLFITWIMVLLLAAMRKDLGFESQPQSA